MIVVNFTRSATPNSLQKKGPTTQNDMITCQKTSDMDEDDFVLLYKVNDNAILHFHLLDV